MTPVHTPKQVSADDIEKAWDCAKWDADMWRIVNLVTDNDDQMSTEQAVALGVLLTRRSSAGGKVKALEWEGDFAHTNTGMMYFIDHATGTPGLVVLEKHHGSSVTKSVWPDINQAKAAAQADFNTRIESALEPLPSHTGKEDGAVAAEFGDKLAAAQTDTDPDIAAALASNRTSLYLRPSPPPLGAPSELVRAIQALRHPPSKGNNSFERSIRNNALDEAVEAVERTAALASQTQGEGALVAELRIYRDALAKLVADPSGLGAKFFAKGVLSRPLTPTLEPSDAEVERAAKAIAENHWSVDGDFVKAVHVNRTWQYHADDARAALIASRQSTSGERE